MTKPKMASVVATAFLASLLAPLLGSSAEANMSSQAPTASVRSYRTCSDLNKVYRHGVARRGAKDKVRGKSKPVRNFSVNNAVYLKNLKLDGDRDGIAFEKR